MALRAVAFIGFAASCAGSSFFVLSAAITFLTWQCPFPWWIRWFHAYVPSGGSKDSSKKRPSEPTKTGLPPQKCSQQKKSKKGDGKAEPPDKLLPNRETLPSPLSAPALPF